MWEAEVRAIRLLEVGLEPRPTRKTVFARDGELRVAQTEYGVGDGGVARSMKTWMKLTYSLAGVKRPRSTRSR
jgi:hypothetical protein